MDDIDETKVIYEYIKEYNEGIREGRRKILQAQNDPRGPGFFDGEKSLMEDSDLSNRREFSAIYSRDESPHKRVI